MAYKFTKIKDSKDYIVNCVKEGFGRNDTKNPITFDKKTFDTLDEADTFAYEEAKNKFEELKINREYEDITFIYEIYSNKIDEKYFSEYIVKISNGEITFTKRTRTYEGTDEELNLGADKVEETLDTFIRDSKQVNDNVITLLNQLQSSLKGAYNLASGLKQQLPNQQPTTNEEQTLYNGKFITSLETIADSVSHWYKEIEEYKKEFAKAHIVIEEVIESFPLEARTKLRESEDPEETYKELVEDLKNRYNSLPEKEKYKDQVLKMKKDLDGFYKNTFKK